MSALDPVTPAPHGMIAWMANNPVVANLIMVVVCVGGLMGLFQAKQEVFPEFELEYIQVSVPYPGASPAEVEQAVLLAIEEQTRALDGVKRVTATASEGSGSVLIETLRDADPDQVAVDVKNAVDRITTFPDEAEKPTVARVSNRRQVISLIISGDQPTASLHALAERARDGLLALDGVTQAEVSGVSDLEIHVEFSRARLEALGLTLNDVATRLRNASLELPAGQIETHAGSILVRMSNRAETGAELGDLIIHNAPGGHIVRLRDVATIRDDYANDHKAFYYNGKRAVMVTVYRVGDETPLGVSDVTRAYADTFRASLPPSVEVATWKDDSEKFRDRIDLLNRNARLGLILVVIVLALFLSPMLAFWVALGIPFSFLGAFMLMPTADLSINMVTLFAFIVTLGLVVDDAIVVGENIYAHMQRGDAPLKSAIRGAQEIAVPVGFSIVTTIVAFMPLFFVPGVMGKLFSLIPAIVVLVLVFSLLESFTVLPAHLGHSHRPAKEPTGAARLSYVVNRRLKRFIHGPYRTALLFCIRHRWSAIAFSVAMLLISASLVTSGKLAFHFFPKIEDDDVTVAIRMPFGADVSETVRIKDRMEQTARQAAEQLGGQQIIRNMFAKVGQASGGGRFGPTSGSGSHLASVEVTLLAPSDGGVRASEFSRVWRKLSGVPAGVTSLNFHHTAGPGAGSDVDVQLSGRDLPTLIDAASVLTKALGQFDQLMNVENAHDAGKPQYDFVVNAVGQSLGLTNRELANQLRASFYGAEALRTQRGRLELKVMTRLDEAERESLYDLDAMKIRTPDGGFAPLSVVADRVEGRGSTNIRREDGARVINVRAELAAGARSPRPVLEAVEQSVLPQILADHPGVKYEFVGSRRESGDTFENLGPNYMFALFVMYALLAAPFRSYIQPLIIMSVIPLGFVGAIWGHVIMGIDMSVVSLFGVIALSGVVVNDSLVLIHAANRLRHNGLTAQQAVLRAGMTRFRPILLTSLTTFFGLAPMILETSIQARFLIPMAISLGFGVMFATFIVLLVVPALYVMIENLRSLLSRISLTGAAKREAV
ncbi:efflux RND transporter permease subunit [Magnetofaba australis]|uniref:Putative acriflavin resistance protein n=1 Tax=Magnetofaba australis IT-1 TaxID=1434232 RepID=A0A1Y2K8M5_9PROT|nr:efflux RND transporter permease subunit [Magnetofaba australis]OSM05145.1 putative acriflavin resistance protein [Magnetofaba australis IT-1]